MIALDLWGALMSATFTDYERMIVAEVVSATYGRLKKRGARLDLTTMAETTNIDRRNLKRALKDLVASKVLSVHQDGSVALQKDWEQWERPAEGSRKGLSLIVGRLLGGIVAFCFGLRDRFGIGERHLTNSSEGADSGGSIQPPEGFNPTPMTTVTGVQSNPLAQVSQGFNPTPCAIEDRARQREKREERTERENTNPPKIPPCTNGVRLGGDLGSSEDEEKHPAAEAERTPETPPEFAALCLKADAMLGYGPRLRGAWLQNGKVRSWWELASRETWEAALAEFAGQANRDPSYLLGIVRRMHAQGPTTRPSAPLSGPREDPHEARRRRNIAGALEAIKRQEERNGNHQ